VSQLHAQVSRRLFRPWFGRIPNREIPVGAVTNAIHVDSWLAESAEVMLMRPCLDPVADEHPDRAGWFKGWMPG
jgi:glycogen phosphorylase